MISDYRGSFTGYNHIVVVQWESSGSLARLGANNGGGVARQQAQLPRVVVSSILPPPPVIKLGCDNYLERRAINLSTICKLLASNAMRSLYLLDLLLAASSVASATLSNSPRAKDDDDDDNDTPLPVVIWHGTAYPPQTRVHSYQRESN